MPEFPVVSIQHLYYCPTIHVDMDSQALIESSAVTAQGQAVLIVKAKASRPLHMQPVQHRRTLHNISKYLTPISERSDQITQFSYAFGFLLPARRYASAGNSDRNVSVRLSVRLSRAGIVSKRRKLASWFLHHLVAPRL